MAAASVLVAIGLVIVLIVGNMVVQPKGKWVPTIVMWWSVSDQDDSLLTVSVTGGGRPNDVRVEIVEQSAEAIRLQGWVFHPQDTWQDVGYPTDVIIRLKRPVGDRQVLSAEGVTIVPLPSGMARPSGEHS